MQLRQLDTAAEILEWPLTILRRATIPLLERDCYSRAWFLTSLVTFLTSSFNLPWATSRLTLMHISGMNGVAGSIGSDWRVCEAHS